MIAEIFLKLSKSYREFITSCNLRKEVPQGMSLYKT
jgi:hypothetical protein